VSLVDALKKVTGLIAIENASRCFVLYDHTRGEQKVARVVQKKSLQNLHRAEGGRIMKEELEEEECL
jgi:hypothetical protein